jgi:hypothetical protein
MAEQTTFFLAIDYIVNKFRDLMEAAGHNDYYVYRGPATGNAGERIQILIAYADEEGSPAIDGTAGTHTMGVPVESYTIDCSIQILDGDEEFEGKATEARAIFNSLVGAIRSDRQLGGLIIPPGLAEIAGFAYVQDHDTDNSYVIAAFSITVREATIWNG